MRERARILLVIYGLLLVAAGSTALKPPRPKFKIATSSTTTTSTTTAEESEEPEEHEATTVQAEVNATTRRTLTGIPQIDYVWDPNLPRELNGFNLSSYPFYSTVPVDEINFPCDGLHDGFYASIEHKCQVYHHCLAGTRYDFLCANFTAFDQRTFICHFASEVDCANSKKYWHRNDALYQATTTTTTSTTTIAPPPTAAPPAPPRPPLRERDSNRRVRPFRRRPAYDYYDEYYDEEYDRTRPRGYDRRDSYEYYDRNYRTDRDRDRDRDRDYRDPVRDHAVRPRERDSSSGYTPTRDAEGRRPAYDDRDEKEREKIPAGRPGRRDRRPVVDQFDEDPRPLVRDRTRDPDAVDYADTGKGDDRRKEAPDVRARDPPRDTDDRRYSDKRYRNDYDDNKDPAPVVTGGSEGLVKPAAPSSSVYARPRAAPKIRRPVPVSEQNKYAYNVSSAVASATPTEEPRRRPDPVDDDYVEDDLEEVRPRRPLRRRPAYRDKEPSYEAREIRDRDRDRDRNYRTRYQDDTDEEIPARKRPDRQRDRHYERGDRPHAYDRDRPTLDRGPVSPAVTERPAAVQYPSRSGERPSGLLNSRTSNRDKDLNRAKFPVREREPPVIPQSEAPKRSNFYRHRTEKPIADNSGQNLRDQDDEEAWDAEDEPSDAAVRGKDSREKNYSEQRFSKPEVIPEPPLTQSRGSHKYEESSSDNPAGIDYPSESSSEYYDEPEEVPASSPRSTLRVVKRPFLPSRGGNPNPRGLKQVGLRVEPRSEEEPIGRPARINPANEGTSESLEDRSYSNRRPPYDAYRTIQSDERQQQRDETVDEDVVTRPQTRRLQKEDSLNGEEDSARSSDREESSPDDYDGQLLNGQTRSESSQQEGPSGIRSQENSEGQKPNEAANRLEGIPESEYDVTLNDALTPTLAQESSLPSGFILPLHRQLEKDTNLQSSQRNYLFSRPTEPVPQLKSSPPLSASSYPVPPIVERSRTTFPRQSQGSIFATGHQQAPWQGYVEY